MVVAWTKSIWEGVSQSESCVIYLSHFLTPGHSNSRNSSTVNPAALAIPPIVKGIHRIIPGNDQNTITVRHDDVFAFTCDMATRSFQRAHRDD